MTCPWPSHCNGTPIRCPGETLDASCSLNSIFINLVKATKQRSYVYLHYENIDTVDKQENWKASGPIQKLLRLYSSYGFFSILKLKLLSSVKGKASTWAKWLTLPQLIQLYVPWANYNCCYFPSTKKKTLPWQNANLHLVIPPCILSVFPDILLVWMCTHLRGEEAHCQNSFLFTNRTL